MIPPEFSRLFDTLYSSALIFCVFIYVSVLDCDPGLLSCMRALEAWLAILQKEGNLVTEIDM